MNYVPEPCYSFDEFPRWVKKDRTQLTRQEALRFNDNWTDQDREKVANEIDGWGDRLVYMYTPPSRQYISGRDGFDQPLFWINHGFISRPDRSVRSKVKSVEIVRLSTRLIMGERVNKSQETREVCSTCWMEKSANGECGCDG